MTSLAPFKDLLTNIVDNRGKTCPVDDQGIPLIATNCVKNATLYPTFEKVRYVSEETYTNWFRGHPKPGDMVFVTKGSPGHVCLTPNPVGFCIAQDMVAIRANEQLVYPKYLFAALRSNSVQHDIANMHVGTLIPHFKKGDFDKLKIPVPSRDRQIFIGDVYFELSRKIELNRQTNETLEALARATFKDWFVDFGPTRAKAEGRPSYLVPELWDLFPDVLDDEDKPVGWQFGSPLELADLISGGTPKTSEPSYWDGTIPWASAKDVSNSPDAFLLDTDRVISKLGLDNSSTRLIPSLSSVVVARGATTGRLCMFGDSIAMNQTCYALRSHDNCHFFTYCWFRDFIDSLVHAAHGSVFDTITTKTFREANVIHPPTKLRIAYEDTTSPLFNKILANLRENQTLAQTRDLLLPKLMSGEIRLREAEKMVEAVA